MADTFDLIGLMLWLSAGSAVVLAFLLLGGGAPLWMAAAALAYGLGAAATARRWRRLELPTGLQWLAASFFAALPLLYGLASGLERSNHG